MANSKMNNTYKTSTQKRDVSDEKQQANTAVRTAQRIQTIEEFQSKQRKQPIALTHEQVSERARAIWKERGCPSGQDEQNWLEAERQLKMELGVN